MARKKDAWGPEIRSLRITMSWKGNVLATATGFIVTESGVNYLVTNRHNLSGRNPISNELLSSRGVEPDSVTILHLDDSDKLRWVEREEPLYFENGEPRWYEHPRLGPQVDVVALPLKNLAGVGIYDYSIAKPEPEPRLEAGDDDLFVIGFPYDVFYGQAMPIWTRASVASAPMIGYGGLPRFLIDAKTRKGQSGSPVVLRPGIRTVHMVNGAMIGSKPEDYYLAGVYSGRLTKDLDIGIVWGLYNVVEIVEGKTRFPVTGGTTPLDQAE